MSDYELDHEMHCLNENCDYTFNLAASPSDPDARAEEGAVSICFNCANIAIFTEEGKGLRPPTADERAEVIAMAEYQYMAQMVFEIQEQRRNG